MKFVVKPVVVSEESKRHTLCILCSEDPRWCGYL